MQNYRNLNIPTTERRKYNELYLLNPEYPCILAPNEITLIIEFFKKIKIPSLLTTSWIMQWQRIIQALESLLDCKTDLGAYSRLANLFSEYYQSAYSEIISNGSDLDKLLRAIYLRFEYESNATSAQAEAVNKKYDDIFKIALLSLNALNQNTLQKSQQTLLMSNTLFQWTYTNSRLETAQEILKNAENLAGSFIEKIEQLVKLLLCAYNNICNEVNDSPIKRKSETANAIKNIITTISVSSEESRIEIQSQKTNSCMSTIALYFTPMFNAEKNIIKKFLPAEGCEHQPNKNQSYIMG